MRLNRAGRMLLRWWVLVSFGFMGVFSALSFTLSVWPIIGGVITCALLGAGGVASAHVLRRACSSLEKTTAWYRAAICDIFSFAVLGWTCLLGFSAILLWAFGFVQTHPVAERLLIGGMVVLAGALLVVGEPILLIRGFRFTRRCADELKPMSLPTIAASGRCDVYLMPGIWFVGGIICLLARQLESGWLLLCWAVLGCSAAFMTGRVMEVVIRRYMARHGRVSNGDQTYLASPKTEGFHEKAV